MAPARDTVALLGERLWTNGPVGYALHGFVTPVFWLTVAGFLLATCITLRGLHHWGGVGWSGAMWTF